MTGPSDSVEALLPPDRHIVIVAGAAAEFLDQPLDPRALCYATDDVLYLMSASGSYHVARVVLEAWAAAPPDNDQDAEAQKQVTLTLSDGTVHVSGMLEFPVSRTLTVGPPGRYHAQVSVTGRAELRRIQGLPSRPIPIVGVEQFRVRFWAADN